MPLARDAGQCSAARPEGDRKGMRPADLSAQLCRPGINVSISLNYIQSSLSVTVTARDQRIRQGGYRGGYNWVVDRFCHRH